jgi:putative isomerase
MDNYQNLKSQLARGWNTWNTRSVLSHTDLPSGFSLNIAVKEYRTGAYLKEALIGRIGDNLEQVTPYSHSYNGNFTSLVLDWFDISVAVKSAKIHDDLVLLLTPIKLQKTPPTIILESGFLWNRAGSVEFKDNHLSATCPSKSYKVFASNELAEDFNVVTQTPYLAVTLNKEIGFSTGKSRNIDEIKAIVEKQEKAHNDNLSKYGDCGEIYNAMQTCMAWDTIYEPSKDRVISTVSRTWNVGSGGYAMFCWDNYFAGFIASLDNKPLAYSNIIEMTNEMVNDSFIPNAVWGSNFKTLDRSQPPVGSTMALAVFKKYKEIWFLEEIFENLYKWNTWFYENRMTENGLLTWGSNPFEPVVENEWESNGVNDTFGAALESGLDNSPMYDEVPFDKQKHILKLDDVGITSLFIMDCNSLFENANILGKKEIAEILNKRSNQVGNNIQKLWDEDFGLFLNKRTDTNEFSYRISPTNFYSIFSKNITDEQVRRMLDEHLYNEKEFWGEYVIPSIARNDKAFLDQTYWRGRIWAPMNFLVYIALKTRGGFEQDCEKLAQKSTELLMKEWNAHHHVHENYSGIDGWGCGIENSDKFYHWGGLLGCNELIEKDFMKI